MDELLLEKVKLWKRARADGSPVYYVQLPTGGGFKSTGKATERGAIEWAKVHMFGGVMTAELTTLRKFATGFYAKDSPYMKLQQGRGKIVTEKHRAQLESILNTYILPEFGDTLVHAISASKVMPWVYKLKSTRKELEPRLLSASRRNLVLDTFSRVMTQAVVDHLIQRNPLDDIERVIVRVEEKEVFVDDEFPILFPADDKELFEIWGSEMWAVFFLTVAECGLRTGEACGLRPEHFFPDESAFIVQNVVNESRESTDGLKTRHSGMKMKPALVSSRLKKLILDLVEKSPGQYIFHDNKGRPFRADYPGKKFKKVVAKVFAAQAEKDGAGNPERFSLGKKTLYSLRHGYNTDTLDDLPANVVRLLMGHSTEAMTAHYNHPTAKALLKRVSTAKEVIERRISQKGKTGAPDGNKES